MYAMANRFKLTVTSLYNTTRVSHLFNLFEFCLAHARHSMGTSHSDVRESPRSHYIITIFNHTQ